MRNEFEVSRTEAPHAIYYRVVHPDGFEGIGELLHFPADKDDTHSVAYIFNFHPNQERVGAELHNTPGAGMALFEAMMKDAQRWRVGVARLMASTPEMVSFCKRRGFVARGVSGGFGVQMEKDLSSCED